jgi:hypothetical protein
MAQTINHHQSNNHHDEHKRVSFGAEEQVTKIFYSEMPADISESYNSNHVTRSTSQFTSPDAPVEKVKVTSEEAEFPRPISPPAQIEDITIATSPPLPSLVKRMEQHDNDNPFRPQEPLYHEVDPIVEAYRNRPFPPSPVGSPIPHEHHQEHRTITTSNTENNGGHHHHTTTTTTTSSNHEYHHSSQHHSYNNETPQKANTSHVSSSTPKRNSSSSKGGDQQYPTISPDTQLLESNDLPPPKHAEIVHLEKKKRCGCCSVQ